MGRILAFTKITIPNPQDTGMEIWIFPVATQLELSASTTELEGGANKHYPLVTPSEMNRREWNLPE